MANNGFDTAHLPERRGCRSVMWDTMATKYGREDLIPLWVADMDFPSPPCIQEALGSRSGPSAESSIEAPRVNAPAAIITRRYNPA